ncbi:hypothetical protein [Niveibacterium sp. SC-1]|uniref:hypothetical protein n=1 Tax=Niveibacterium sp. SC-1 TaxID=3135646 RepID=UPI00311DF977
MGRRQLMGYREYAEHRKARGLGGTTLRAVQKAIETGRITTVADEKGRAKIDPEVADIQWTRHTDTLQSARANAPRLAAVGSGAAAQGTGGADGGGEEGGNPYWVAKTRREQAEAAKAEIELHRLAESLVPRADVHRAAFEAGRLLRDMILAVPAKVAAEIASLTDPATIERRLREELRRPLDQVSKILREDAPAEQEAA